MIDSLWSGCQDTVYLVQRSVPDLHCAADHVEGVRGESRLGELHADGGRVAHVEQRVLHHDVLALDQVLILDLREEKTHVWTWEFILQVLKVQNLISFNNCSNQS